MARRIGSRNREAERRIMEALQTRLSVRMERAMIANIGKAYLAAADQTERYMPVTVGAGDTGRILLAGWDTAASTFGQRMSDQLGKRHGHWERKSLWSEAFRAAFFAFSTQWIATKITQINGTTEEQIRRVVLEGEQEGWGVDKIARALRDQALPMSKLRSHVIARTETHFASGWANQQAAEESGVELVKEWCASGDERTREAHQEADGQRQPMPMAFNVGGASLMYPGDASGPAEEVIMCFPEGTTVNNAAHGAMRRWYDGKLYGVDLGWTEVFATPNHPILTARGWVPINEITQFDSVIGMAEAEYVSRANPDEQGAHSDISKVFDLFHVSTDPSRVPATSINFHGEIPDNEVDVITTDGLFRDIQYIAQVEKFLKSTFPDTLLAHGGLSAFCNSFEIGLLSWAGRSDIGRLNEPLTLYGVGVSHAMIHSLRPIARFYADALKRLNNITPAFADIVSNSLDAHSRLVSRDNLGAQMLKKDLSEGLSRMSDNGFMGIGHGDAKPLADIGYVLGEDVRLHKVVGVNVRDFSGHVYNLESGSNTYFANGIVAHNCRCQSLYVEP